MESFATLRSSPAVSNLRIESRRSAIQLIAHSAHYRRCAEPPFRSDIGQVIKTIVDDEAFPDYAMTKKSTGRKKRRR